MLAKWASVLFSIFFLSGCAARSVVLNDVHSRLNATRVAAVAYPTSTQDVVKIVLRAKRQGKAISISGSRHAMGGQQFGHSTVHISTMKLNDVLDFNRKRGILRVESGIEWPQLVAYLIENQKGEDTPWSIVQKQTGADRLSIGGAVSANVHGRGVRFKPFVQDIESFTLVNADGQVLTVSRAENPELFRLAVGGYGLFGVITTVDLRLMPRTKLRRVVEVVSLDDLPQKARQRLSEGFLYGDFQYKTDKEAADFMRVGVFSTYKPVPAAVPVPDRQKELTRNRWYELMLLAHTDKARAFDLYAKYYLTTDGQIYWSDLHQTSEYLEDYVEYLKKVRPDMPEGSLMISELYVPRSQVKDFIEHVIAADRERRFNIIYGTLRLIERDDETFLAWAREPYACIIFNLRVDHSSAGLEKAKGDFQKLIDLALERGGSFYLTYHRWARKDQVLRAYPQFVDFLRLKLKHDPDERFQSEWYRHYKDMFVGEPKSR